MASHKPTKVLLFQDDYERMKKWVLRYQDSETGGQIFGLWKEDRKPYVNIVIGPGQDCKHGTHSFHQDMKYLKRVGKTLNQNFMMCHIGEWHSHHRLRLSAPSHGDLNSIWNNFPQGVDFFLLIIATIEGSDTVRLNPWIFSASKHEHSLIDVEYISGKNPFMKNELIKEIVTQGAESDQQYLKNVKERQLLPRQKLAGKRTGVNEERPWFHEDKASCLLKILKIKLEDIKDPTTEVLMNLNGGILIFSFVRNQCKIEFIFSNEFSGNFMEILCSAPGSSSPLKMRSNFPVSEENVNALIDYIKAIVPTRIYHGAIEKYAS